MSRLSGVYRLGSAVLDHYHADTDSVVVQRQGTTTTDTYSATIYAEKIRTRRDPSSRSGDRQRVATRIVILAPDVATVPVLSSVTVNSQNYNVEHSKVSPASGNQILHLIRTGIDQISRPNSWH